MKPENPEPSGEAAANSPRAVSLDRAMRGTGRRHWFRLVALMLPFVAVLLLEAALRLAGYGYPTSFFVKAQVDGKTVFVENPKFGWRYFPPAVARSPLPLQLEPRKPPGTIRIFLFGESAAMGDPEPAYGCARQLERLLQARHPNKRIEVVNVAMTAINSHVIRDIACDCAALEGDLWLIYAGNNEVVGPFGAGTVFGPQTPNLAAVRALITLKSFRTGQLLSGLRQPSHAPAEWEGMEMFLRNQVTADDPRLQKVYQHFARNLSAVIQTGKKAGAKIVISTVPTNLKDCPPFGSSHRAGLSAGELKQWEEHFAKGREAELQARPAEALAAYDQAAALDAEFAELNFRRALCQSATAQTAAAKTNFALARDRDTLRFRADSRLSEIIHGSGASALVPLVDTERELMDASPNGAPGDEFFYDHVHLNFSGNYRLATLLARQVEKELFGPMPTETPFLSESELAHQLAFTDFDRHRVIEEMRARLQQPPFSAQSNFKQRDQRLEQALAAAHPSPADSTWEYRAALVVTPNDWVLRENFGRLLEVIGDRAGALEQWSQIVELLPLEPEGYFHLGNLAYDAASYADAANRFREALQRRPGSTEALNGLGLVLAAQGRTNEALAQFQAILKNSPRFSAARVNLAVLRANRGELASAVSEYQTVLRLDTNNAAARVNLARLFFGQGKTNEAIALYSQALELRPDNPIAQFDLGNALSACGRHAEALNHYAAAVQYQPGFADARYNLALELARAGKITDALPHFAEAVRLRPNAAETHFNYAVALAKTQHYAEAATQFEETLKLEPNHPSARALLNRTLQLQLR